MRATSGLSVLMLLMFSCNPESLEDVAPAHLEVSPLTLEFAADEDTQLLEIHNTGGKPLDYEITISAQSGGVTWLSLAQESGALEGETSKALLVRVLNRDLLSPGSYSGQIQVTSDAGGESVSVTVLVAQPVLAVEPADVVDFGTDDSSRTVVISNSGEGTLFYGLQVPGDWLSSEQDLQGQLAAGEPMTITLELDRTTVPWYGDGDADLIVISNGLDTQDSSQIVSLTVKVYVDPSCTIDDDCTLAGFFCDLSLDGGTCSTKAKNGQPCVLTSGCKSGYCVDGVCCNQACDQSCRTCGLPTTLGICSPETDGSECDDGKFCTDTDSCTEGMCSGSPRDCAAQDSECAAAICNEEAGQCLLQEPQDWCAIEDICYDGGISHPVAPCLICAPETTRWDWSIVADTCHIGNNCYAAGEATDEECQVCDSEHPEKSSPAPDSTECDDGNICTVDDQCSGGACTSTPKNCSDNLPCTADSCDGNDGSCSSSPLPGWCVIDNKCVPEGTVPQEGKNAGCLACLPAISQFAWSAAAEGQDCEDLNACSAASICEAGECIAVGGLCDDADECTQDLCTEELTCEHPPEDDGFQCTGDTIDCTDDICQSGKCSHPVTDGFCLIDDLCAATNAPSGASVCLGCVPDTSQTEWSPINEGGDCDDSLFCTVEDLCLAGICTGTDQVCPTDQCNTSWCSEELDKCIIEAVANETGCDDQDSCTVSDQCQFGTCTGAEKYCGDAAGENPCLDGVCDANSDPPGECVAIAVEQGTLCEDDLICTLETVCDGSGGCNGGNQKDAAVCEQELNNDDPCLVGACHEPQGCVLEAANEGMECDLTGAFAQCLEGECSKIHCLDGYDDCDDATPGCETAVHFDPNNCGKCSEICNLEQSLDTCYLGSCVIVECKDDYANCDQEHDTGCEVPLLEDPEHCGECGLVCESTAVSQVGICLLGLCAETECPEGAIDGDGMPGNGCEIQNIVFVDAANIDDPGQTGATDHAFATIQQGVDAAQPGFTVFVRDGNYAETVIINGKDSLLLTGESQDFVHLSVPEYETGIEVTSNDVTVQNMTINGGRIGLHFKAGLINPLEDGLATSLTFIDILAPNNTDTDAAAVMIEYATDIVVSDILVDGVTAGYGKNLRVSISSPCLQADRGGIGAGIRLTGAANCNLTGNIISAIKGGAGGQAYAWSMDHSGSVPGYAGPAAGIYLETSVAIAVSDNILTDCTGGKGGHAGWLTGLNPGTAGGVGSGVYLVATSDSTIHGNTIQTMTGGEGGSQSGHMCGVGGVAAGVYLADSTGNTLTANTITSLTGGTPGYFSAPDFYFPPSQEGYGIYLDNDSLDNSVENSNTMTEEPIVFLYNGNGESISGYQLTADVNPTNWGKIAVFNSTDITVSNNTISGYKGQMAQTVGCLDQPGVVAGEGVGIRVEECLNCTVVDNVVNSIEGGTGGPHMSPVHPGSTGAEGTGILVRASNNTEVTGNEVSSVMGGRGAFRRHSTNEGTGGRGSGILIHQGEDHSVSNNRVAEISGGPGGYVYGTPAGKGGRGSGIVLEDVSKTSLSGNMIVQVEGGAAGTPVAGGTYTPGQSDGADGLVSINSSVISILNTTIGKVGRGPDEGMNPVSTGLHLENSSQVTIQHLTCTEIGSLTGETGHGVSVGTLPSSPVQILDSIITDVSGYCLWNHENNSQLYLKADYTDLNQCTSGEQSNAVVQSHCLAVDPLFFNPAAALYTLKSDSLCIDSGHPDSPYDNELDPNGCNANMGAFGNTEEAASAIGAQHCE